MKAIMDNFDPVFDRGVLENIKKIQDTEIIGLNSNSMKSKSNRKNLARIDEYNSQIQYIRELIIQGKIDDYETIMKDVFKAIDCNKPN